ncbi:hypothetical protein M422DRAFT_256929 [Sphaerobolus stellatus SS14]|uniref:Stealth protein CR3 conserved region 3 domain-containing protein n=1 Tax=Sphaerobolus stellatus (strain SS14) TaxID=990650 RepID=A0A0C9VQD0_SPHS4|nr:hypothetical protein M422DRAFT_256929 [Sphaerobolus stellatus SS14]
MNDLTRSDFYSSAYGIVLRLNPDSVVGYDNETAFRRISEPSRLEFTNYYLGKRFGYRERPHIRHIAKTMSLTLLQEFSVIWQQEIVVTTTYPFREMTSGHPDIYMLFLFVHSLVERWREALL